MEKLKKRVLMTIGLILIPIFLFTFILDRIITAPLFWIQSDTFSKYLNNAESIAFSLIRIFTITFFIVIFTLIY